MNLNSEASQRILRNLKDADSPWVSGSVATLGSDDIVHDVDVLKGLVKCGMVDVKTTTLGNNQKCRMYKRQSTTTSK